MKGRGLSHYPSAQSNERERGGERDRERVREGDSERKEERGRERERERERGISLWIVGVRIIVICDE